MNFSIQCKRFLWDMGCIYELIRGCLDGLRKYLGCNLCEKRLRLS